MIPVLRVVLGVGGRAPITLGLGEPVEAGGATEAVPIPEFTGFKGAWDFTIRIGER